MTEFKCGNCREVMLLSPNARYCSYCGSNSLILIVTELQEPAQKESLGVYVPLDVSNISTEDLVPKDARPRKNGRTATRS